MPAHWPVDLTEVHGDLGVDGGVVVQPLTGGLFHDFSTGAPGVRILGEERPCPGFIDATTVTGTGSLVYAAPSEVAPGGVTFPGIPMWAKMTSTTGSSEIMTFAETSFHDKATSCGRFYVYFPVNIGSGVRLAQINTDTGLFVQLRLDTGRTISVLNPANTVFGTSAFALAAGTVYRIEWRIVCAPDGTATVSVYIYSGHATTPAGSVTSSAFTIGKQLISGAVGNTGGTNLGGKSLYMAAVAVNCDALPGPYLRQENSTVLVSPDGVRRYEFGPNGDLVMRANRDFQITDGGTDHYLHQEGDIVGRFGNDGLFIGAGSGVGDPSGISDFDLHDLSMDVKNRRTSARGGNYRNLHDPPDVAFSRYELLNTVAEPNYGAIGTGAATTAGSNVVTFSDLTLIMRNRGHGIVIAGSSYNIAEILSPTSCTVKPTPAATGTGLAWKLKWFPYPLDSQLTGNNSGATLAQPCRILPTAYQAIGSGTSGVSTTSGSAVVDITPLSAGNKALWTVGRRVLINDDVTLAANTAGKTYKIVSVAGDGNSVTLSGTVGSTLANVKWKLAASDTEGGADRTNDPLMTNHWDAVMDIVNWSSNTRQGAIRATWGGLPPSSIAGGIDMFSVEPAGGFSALAGLGRGDVLALFAQNELGYPTGAGSGGQVTQSSSKSTGVTINKPTGKIIMNGASLAASTSVSFVVTNSVVLQTDVVMLSIKQNGTAGAYVANVAAVADGSFTVHLRNVSAAPLSEAVHLNFAILRGAAT